VTAPNNLHWIYYLYILNAVSCPDVCNAGHGQ